MIFNNVISLTGINKYWELVEHVDEKQMYLCIDCDEHWVSCIVGFWSLAKDKNEEIFNITSSVTLLKQERQCNNKYRIQECVGGDIALIVSNLSQRGFEIL